MVPARSAAGLQFAELARVTAAALGGDNHLLLVAGTSAGSGCGVVAANLAATLARTRSEVILVCPGDQRALEILGLAGAPQLDPAAADGLAAGTVSLAQVAVQPAGFPGLAVLILGSGLSELRYEHARQLALRLRGSARYVIIEAPAAAAGADSLALAEFCDAALVTVEMPRTKRPELENRIGLLGRLGIRILGLAAVPRLRLAHRRSRAPMVAKHPHGLDSTRPEAAAAAPDGAGSPEAGQPAAKSAANQGEDPALVLSAQARAETADKIPGD